MHHVRNVHEITRLVAVTVDRRRLSLQGRGNESRHDGRVLRARILAWPEDIAVPEHNGFQPVARIERRAIRLARELGRGSGRQGARDVVLGVGERRGIAIGRCGAGVDHPPHSRVARCHQDGERSRRVHAMCGQGLAHRALDRRGRGLVQHALHVLHRTAADLGIRDAALDEMDAVGDRGEILPPPRRQVVQDHHLVPGGDKVLHHVRADEAGSARNQESHPLRFVRPDSCSLQESGQRSRRCGGPGGSWRSGNTCFALT